MRAAQVGHFAKQNGLEAVAQGDKVRRGQGLLTQIGKAAPEHAVAVAQGLHAAVAERERLIAAGPTCGQLTEGPAEHTGQPRRGDPVTGMGDTWVQAMVFLAVDAHYLHMPLQGGHRRQKALAIKAFGIQQFRWLVGSGHQHHALFEHHLKQAAENDRIADIADKQFVETQHAHLAAQLNGQRLQRIRCTGELKQAPMHPAHKVVKVLTSRGDFQAFVEAVHQPGLATAHRPPQIHPVD